MKLNDIAKIPNDSGEYLILVDYGTEGLRVVGQYKTLAMLMKHYGRSTHGSSSAVVKLIDIQITEDE